MDDITGNFVTECLIKVHTFFESMCGKKSAGWIDKLYKKNFWSIVFQHKYKTTLTQGICMLQMFVTILTAGWYRPAYPVQL